MNILEIMNKKHFDKVIIASDSFKESLSSKEIALIGMDTFEPFINCCGIAIADGGEGTVDFFINEMHYQKQMVESVNAFGEKITTYFAFNENQAVFDASQIVGFKVNNHLDIKKASTYGIGLVLKTIIEQGFKEIILGLGGTITNDGGAGLLEGIGAKFKYQGKEVILHQTPFVKCDFVDLKEVESLLKDIKITALADVSNPLLGENGATYVFAKQKGASLNDLIFLENWMMDYAKIFPKDLIDYEKCSSCGAAGGLGFALNIMGALIKSGIDTILDLINFDDLLDDKTLVISGEGKIDQTTLNGKLINKIQKRVENKDATIVLICGVDELKDQKLLVYPFHDKVVANFRETAKADLVKTFFKIIKDLIIDEALIHLEKVPFFDKEYRALREEVFVIEQNVDENIEFDEDEEKCEHYKFYYNNKLCGVFRIKYLDNCVYLQRFLIRKCYRKFGLGHLLMDEALNVIKNQGHHLVLIHAQIQAQTFYEKCGFKAFGEPFIEANIEHIHMKIAI